jgi:RecB family exonuclease
LPPLRAHLERQGGALSGGDRRPVDRLELVRELDRALGVVEALPSRGRVGSHAAALWAALRQLGTTQALVSSPPEPLVGAGSGEERSRSRVASAETALALERLGEVLSELAGLRDVSGVRGAGWPSLSRGEFAGLLGAALAGEPAPAGRDVAAGVALCDPGALVGRRFDHVFLLGLVDREAEGDGEALLPAALREAICRRLERPAALRASGRVAQRKQERLGLYLACCSARLTLSASAPRMDVGGSPIEPAALLRELARVAGREEPERLERPLLPVGELCLTRGEAIAAHWQDPALRSAEPGPVAQVAQLAERERRRREAIIAGRADPASGALAGGSEGAAELLARLVARLERKPLSPSLLELMAGCGFRALCDRILDLGPPEERGEELAANEGGTVRHACLKAAFEALGREGLLPLEGGTRRRRELQTFLGGANAALDAYEREAPVGHPTVWAAERRTIVRQLVRVYGRELTDRGWEPAYFELGFQREAGGDPAQAPPQLSLWAQPRPADEPRRDPIRLDLPGGAVLLGGKVDRVDRRAGGLRVIDYKTGGIDSKQRHLAEGFGETQLQLAIYALLVRQALAPASTVDAAYISISEAKLSKTIATVCGQQEVDLELFLATDDASRARCRDEQLPNLVERIATLVARARAGEFPVTPGDCRYCDHVSACRVGPYYEELD